MTAYAICKNPLFEATSLTVIVINSITLALDDKSDDDPEVDET